LVAECPACHESVTIRKFTTGKGFANFASSTNIRQAMSMIALCDLVVSPVTAPLVMATSLEIPTVGLFGAFSTKNRTKYYDKFLAVEGKSKCRPCAVTLDGMSFRYTCAMYEIYSSGRSLRRREKTFNQAPPITGGKISNGIKKEKRYGN